MSNLTNIKSFRCCSNFAQFSTIKNYTSRQNLKSLTQEKTTEQLYIFPEGLEDTPFNKANEFFPPNCILKFTFCSFINIYSNLRYAQIAKVPILKECHFGKVKL